MQNPGILVNLQYIKPLITTGKICKLNFKMVKKASNDKTWTSSYSPTQEEFLSLQQKKT